MITTIQQKEEKALGIVFFSYFWRAGEAKRGRGAQCRRQACILLFEEIHILHATSRAKNPALLKQDDVGSDKLLSTLVSGLFYRQPIFVDACNGPADCDTESSSFMGQEGISFGKARLDSSHIEDRIEPKDEVVVVPIDLFPNLQKSTTPTLTKFLPEQSPHPRHFTRQTPPLHCSIQRIPTFGPPLQRPSQTIIHFFSTSLARYPPLGPDASNTIGESVVRPVTFSPKHTEFFFLSIACLVCLLACQLNDYDDFSILLRFPSCFGW